MHIQDITFTECRVFDNLPICERILGAVWLRILTATLLNYFLVANFRCLRSFIETLGLKKIYRDSPAREAAKMMYVTIGVSDSMRGLLLTS